MPLAPGTFLGPYEIGAPLGAGGMGEVYRARDTRLERTVAVKILPAQLSSDSVHKQRFEREAKTISGLNHPNICTLHDVGSQDGVDYLVMECVEGETLAKRLEKGPLPMEQSLRYGAQIADALDKAHRSGVVHRDLKPGNIMLTATGAKLLDFGLAKPTAPLSGATLTAVALTNPVTQEGTIVGTFHYMSPEQVEGKEVDGRSDIFSLGAVLYEMVTGKRAFEGKSQLSVASAILEKEPAPISTVKPLTPPALDHAIRKCLAKISDERWQSAGDLASELKWIADGGSGTAVRVAGERAPRSWIPWTLAFFAVCAAAVLVVIHQREKSVAALVIHSLIAPEEGTSPLFTGDFAGPAVIAPDGTALAFVASPTNGAPLLWVRKLNDPRAHSLQGTEGATFPFWSPDSRSIGFFAGGKLKTVSPEGGRPFEVCDAPTARGGTWSSKGIIVFAPSYIGSLSQVSARGGVPSPLTVLDRSKHDSHRWPHFLADGDHFLYLAITHSGKRGANDGVYFSSLNGKENHLVLRGESEAKYAAGRLLYEHDNVLMAQRFDPVSGVPEGEAERLAENVLYDSTTWKATFDVAGKALLAYATGGIVPSQPMWYDRTGKELGAAGSKAFNLNSVRLSSDGSKLLTESGQANADVWVYDLRRNVNTRLTFENAGASSSPIWSPDGRWVAYVGVRSTSSANVIYRKPANGGGQEELLVAGDSANRILDDWSPDGKSLLFTVGDTASTGEIWMAPLTGEHKPAPLVQGNFVAAWSRFSPDGHWIAYSSTESGRPEVYVIPFNGSIGKWQISDAGGTAPVWRRDGKELFYWSADNSLRSVEISLKSGVVEIGVPRILAHWNSPISTIGVSNPLDVTNDGQRFVAVAPGQPPSRPITLVTNWDTELKK
jgi:eukaryotic-like serine/threonine-protein kinase